MSSDLPLQRTAGARPVADAPVQGLVERAEEMSRRWVISLLAGRALSQMADVPIEELAREAPGLCSQLVRALASDAELAQMLDTSAGAGEGVRRSRELRRGGLAAWIAPGSDATSVVRDVESLRSVIWEGTLGELREPSARQVADLADRLAFICAALLAAVLEPGASAETRVVDTTHEAASVGAVLHRSPQTSPSGRRAVLIDELLDPGASAPGSVAAAPLDDRGGAASPAAAAADRREASSSRPTARAAGRTAPTAPRARPWDIPLNSSGAGDIAPAQDRHGHATAPDGAGQTVRITRGPRPRVDERS